MLRSKRFRLTQVPNVPKFQLFQSSRSTRATKNQETSRPWLSSTSPAGPTHQLALFGCSFWFRVSFQLTFENSQTWKHNLTRRTLLDAPSWLVRHGYYNGHN